MSDSGIHGFPHHARVRAANGRRIRSGAGGAADRRRRKAAAGRKEVAPHPASAGVLRCYRESPGSVGRRLPASNVPASISLVRTCSICRHKATPVFRSIRGKVTMCAPFEAAGDGGRGECHQMIIQTSFTPVSISVI